MNIVKIRQDFYRVTAYVVAIIVESEKQVMVYEGEMAFKMQPDITAAPILPLKPFCRHWERHQSLGIPDGQSDLEAALSQAITHTIKRLQKLNQKPNAHVDCDVQLIEIAEQEDFHMTGLHPDFQNGVIRFYLQRT